MNLQKLEDALLSVSDAVYHFDAGSAAVPYIVWGEDGQSDSVWADNKMQAQAITGTVDYFTKSSKDININRLQQAMNDSEISWKLESIQYEDETALYHYEWVWSIWLD